jgi:hypothetical protein
MSLFSPKALFANYVEEPLVGDPRFRCQFLQGREASGIDINGDFDVLRLRHFGPHELAARFVKLQITSFLAVSW